MKSTRIALFVTVASLSLFVGACGDSSSDSGDPPAASGGSSGSGGSAGKAGGGQAGGGQAGKSGGAQAGGGQAGSAQAGGGQAGSSQAGGGQAGSSQAGQGGSTAGGGQGGEAGQAGGGQAGAGGEQGGSGGLAGQGGGGSSGVDKDGDGSDASADCDDNDATRHPGATEVCNGVDDNCDGATDEGTMQTFYLDEDHDNFGVDTAGKNVEGCAAPSGYTPTAGDCDDANPAINPGAAEECNGADDNCDGSVDEGASKITYYADSDGDGFGAEAGSMQACTPPAGAWVTTGGDCDDKDKVVFPGSPEVCDGKDNDCDPATKEPSSTVWYKDGDGDGFGDPGQPQNACAQPAGYVANQQDCDDKNKDINPNAVETCDGKDNNCVGGVDEGPLATYPDADGDGFGDAKAQPTYRACYDATHLADNTDCDDASKAINPSANEIPSNKIDENCDGSDSSVGLACGFDTIGAATLPYTTTTFLNAFDKQPGNPAGANRYWDDFELATKAGDSFTLLMSSREMKQLDPHLYLGVNECKSTLSNSSWYSLHPVDHTHRSRITVPSAQAGYYYAVLTTDQDNQMGAYEMAALPGQFGKACGKQDLGLWPLGWRQAATLNNTNVETGSPIFDGWYGHDYEFWAEAGKTYTVLMGGSTFQPFVYVSSAAKCDTSLGSSNKGVTNKGARLVFTPSATGTHTAWTTTSAKGATGSYAVNVVPGNVGESCFSGAGQVAGTGDSDVFWPISGSTSQALELSDRVDSWLPNRYFDDFETWLEAGESVTITVTSTEFVPRVMLTSGSNCSSVIISDFPAIGTKASITYTPTKSGIYTIIASSRDQVKVGKYTLSGQYN